MSKNPLVLLLTFLLELAALVALGIFGWSLRDDWLRIVPALAIPTVGATIWGVFRVPGDPTDAIVAVPGRARLLLEGAFFGSAAGGLWLAAAHEPAVALAIAVVLTYAASWDRVLRMLANRLPGD